MPDAPWRVLIADDEPVARRGVRQLLASFADFVVAGECRNGAEVLSRLDEAGADVIFLDVQMPGVDGFDVIRKRTPERMPIVVFLTAFDDYAIRAFEVQALDYLVKPVSAVRFARTMERVRRQLSARAEPPPEIVITTASGTTLLPLREIDWIEAADCYARVWTGRRSYLLRQSLRELEERLRGHGFVRAHRRALVRLDRIRALTPAQEPSRLMAVLTTGAEIPISRRLRGTFVAAVRKRGVG